MREAARVSERVNKELAWKNEVMSKIIEGAKD